MTKSLEKWKKSRSGAWASRGFHYQHLFSTLILVRQWAGLFPSGYLVPEGIEDCVVELSDYDMWIQIKSRNSGTFSENEVHSILKSIKHNANSKTIKLVVALEKPCYNYQTYDIEDLFNSENPKVVVCNDPKKEILELLTSLIQTSMIIAKSIANDLFSLIADASQENASLSFEDRRRISTTEVERLIFERLEAEDPSAINHALASGAIEPVDFRNPINDPSFYKGVKVSPGHVAAGLVLDRPQDVDKIVNTLRQKRHVLISGPSGAGKSALMWLTAQKEVKKLRWYQINARATISDVDSIIRFIRAHHLTEEFPIGLAFDDVNTTNSDLWNMLAHELRGFSSVYFLSSIRQEDVVLITNQSDVEFITVKLDENLAKNFWQKLYDSQQTSWKHWREPFEQSSSLMLEYMHILTQEKRLQSVINDQVRQRQQQKRHDELAIIRCTSIICALGAEVRVEKLCYLLGIEHEAASQALSRLLDEHLVKEVKPGILGGMHMLRSHALSKASHDEAVFRSMDSFWQGLLSVTNESLSQVIQSIFREAKIEKESTILYKLANILSDSSDLETWISIMTGLGFATLERHAILLMQILEKHEVPVAQWSLASMFIDPNIDISDFKPLQSIRDAIFAFRILPKSDLRLSCLEYLPKESIIPSCQNIKQANKLFSCMVPICNSKPVSLSISFDFAGGENQNIQQVASLLSTAYLIDPDIAKNIMEALGGEQTLFNWFHSQTPWVTMPTIDPNGKHGRTVRSNWYYIDEQKYSDPHEIVCGICETLIAISPESDAAASDAVNPQGESISVDDFAPYFKNMPRQNIFADTRVAWNVAFRKIFLARSSANNLTDYTQQMAALIKRTEKIFRSFTEKWIKAKNITNTDKLANEINEIIETVNKLAYCKPSKLSSEMTASAQNVSTEDTLGVLLVDILGNLIKRMIHLEDLSELKAMAVFAGKLAMQTQEYENSQIWQAHSQPPLNELQALKIRLNDIANILHEMAYDTSGSFLEKANNIARKSQLGRGVHTVARRFRSTSELRFREKLKKLKNTFKNKSWDVQCYAHTIDALDSIYWPAKKVAVLIEIDDFETYLENLEDFMALCQEHLEWQFSIVPLLNGYVIPTLAMVSAAHMPLYDQNFEKIWQNYIDYPFLCSPLLDKFDKAMGACFQLSAILTCCNLENSHPDEEGLWLNSLESFNHNSKFLAEILENTESENIAWAYDCLVKVWDQVVQEFEAIEAGRIITAPLCLKTYQTSAGQIDEQLIATLQARIFILQDEFVRTAENNN